MKIYEIRDISEDEVYYVKAYFLTAEEAIVELKRVGVDISEDLGMSDSIIGAVYEHEINSWNLQSKKIFELTFEYVYDEETDSRIWEPCITFPKELK